MEGLWMGRVLNFIFECLNLTRGVVAAVTIIVLSQMTSQALEKNNDFYKNNPVLRLRVQHVRRLLRTITIAFSILVIPADAFHVIYHTMTWTMKLTPETFAVLLNIHVLLKLLQSSNSAFNFIIYAGMKGDVNNFLRKLSRRVVSRSRFVVNVTEKKGEERIPRKLTTLSTISSTGC
uniref:G-protein coupled receptors family 1 profile domain-containing protein n=3 Tax=Clytia hemisphaerica TaxID=252671 RepID=A0A7M5VCX3_9CNID